MKQQEMELSEVDEETQEAKDEVVEEVMQAIYKPTNVPKMLTMISKAQDPIAKTAEYIVEAIQTLDGGLDGTIPEEAIIPAAIDIAGLVFEMLNEAGVLPEDAETFEKLQQYVIAEAMDQYGDEDSSDEFMRKTGQEPPPRQPQEQPPQEQPPQGVPQ